MKRKKKNHNGRIQATKPAAAASRPFIEHLHELRQRLYYVAASVILWACAAYGVEHHIVDLLLIPARGEHFIYTSAGGGIDFLFRICLYAGLILSTPVIVYNILRFFEPLFDKDEKRFIVRMSIACGILAFAGMIFGFYLGLPSAVHFLLHQFTTVQIQPLLTIQSYLNFVLAYMFGASLLFQLPLILLFINRIKPLNPKSLFRYERWVILIAFVMAALMNPSPNLLSQLVVAAPFITMYQLGIAMIWLVNKGPAAKRRQLLKQDRAAALQRRQIAQNARYVEEGEALFDTSDQVTRPRNGSYRRVMDIMAPVQADALPFEE